MPLSTTTWILPLPLAAVGCSHTAEPGEVELGNGIFDGYELVGEPGDWAGSSVAVLDLDADGHADIALGAEHFPERRGRVYGVFPRGERPRHARLSRLVDLGRAFSAEGPLVAGNFGHVVSRAGDVNADGLEDLIVGEPAIATDHDLVGQYHVLLGTAESLPSPSFSTGAGTVKLSGDLDPATHQVWFGASASGVGDVNGDGYDDLAITSRVLPRPSESSNLSATYCVFGGPDLKDLEVRSTVAAGGGFAIEGLSAPIGRRGVAPLGDWNGDGLADFIIQGAIVFGAASADPVQIAELESSGRGILLGLEGIDGEDPVGAADVNGDGKLEALVGASRYGPGPDSSGRVYVILGGSAAPISTGDLEAEVSGYIVEASIPGSFLGLVVAGVGDLDGDGRDEIATTSWLAADGRGRVHILRGSDAPKNVLLSEDSPGDLTFVGSAEQDFLASDITAGDLDGDGTPELVLGNRHSQAGGSQAGRVIVLDGAELMD